ncbi:hypothetical protein FisN_26Hu124 [Fistulifera solaris]|uniref:Uncharacterized protein n=1 Tax=Fistulifera solaris TaxID=1519565 RepID=A0A1Z5JXS5_FISSO|nr:hypothetical protein FisN_26Hu124 [Fistulifera solaris]|eukprot:GAX18823.1 hypothetical protein FisN_26Hu124 [Fistulifera solaris]
MGSQKRDTRKLTSTQHISMTNKPSILSTVLAILALSHARIQGDYEPASLSRLIRSCEVIRPVLGGDQEDDEDDKGVDTF